MTDTPPTGATPEQLRQAAIAAIRKCYDPEIPVNIYDLGLIYDVSVDENGVARIEMTLTSPACPVAGTLPPEVEERVRAVDGISSATVDLVWDPPWSPDLMTEEAKLELGLM